MKKAEIKLVKEVISTTKVGKYNKRTFCNRKSVLNLFLLQFLLSFLLVGCVSTRHAPVVKNTPPTENLSLDTKKYHTVQKGDTLYSIAKKYNIDYKNLANWNGIENPSAINVGQQLILSSPAQMTEPSIFALPDPEPSSQVEQSISETTNSISSENPSSAVAMLKIEPKALKLQYSEQAISQLQESENILPTAIANRDDEKFAESEKSNTTIISTETTRDSSGIEWIWPTEGRISSHFSESTKGMDISGKTGQPVLASASGKVVYSGTGLRGYGQLIIIKHNSTYLSAYAHNSKLLVKEGEIVSRGQKIAEMGNTDSKLVRLHFEIRKNGKPVDPLKHLPVISSDTVL